MHEKTKPAFKKSGIFCSSNWNDKKCNKLRGLLYELTEYKDKTYKSERFKIERRWHSDQNYYFITSFTELGSFLCIVTWYKSRGRTDMILTDGSPIYEEQMNFLLKDLRKEIKKKDKRELEKLEKQTYKKGVRKDE